MPFHILRNDIAAMEADAIVNTANPMPVVGPGVDSAIHKAAGPELLAARKKLGKLLPGQCAVTPGFRLKAQYVIHAVGPVWKGGLLGEGKLLRKCYEDALFLAKKHGCESVAFPLISTGAYGFPKERAMRIALNAIGSFLLREEMTVYLVVFDGESFRLSGNLFDSVASYIDENYVNAHMISYSRPSRPLRGEGMLRSRAMSDCEMAPCAPMPKESKTSLEEMLRKMDAGFTETLLKLIDRTGQKDSQVYKRANITKQHFSKIRNNPDYRPTKATAVALALALELDLEQTKDLIGRAGYALSNSSKFDLIIRYFIEQRNYDIMQINLVLYEFDQTLLGA